MTLRKKIQQLGLLILAIFSVGMLAPLSVDAATLPTGTSLVSTDSSVYSASTSGEKVPNTTIAGNTPSALPTLVSGSLAANNLSSTKRVTVNSTTIGLVLTGSLRMPSGATVKSVSLDVTNSFGASVVTSSNNLAPNSSTSAITFSSMTYLKATVDLSDLTLRQMLSLYIGLRVENSDGTVNHYSYAQIKSSDSVTAAMTPVTMKSTYTSSGGGNLANIKNTDTSVSGTGAPNEVTWMPLTNASGDVTNLKTTSDASGNYTFNLEKPLGSLHSKSTVGVVQTNDMGDSRIATAQIHKVLDIKIANPTLDLYPDEMTDNVTGKTDSEVLAWLIKEGGISVSNLGTLLDNANLIFSADKSGLANLIESLGDNQSTDIAISAKDSAGTATDGSVTITVTKHNGELNLGDITNFDFGTMATPTKEVLLAPEKASVTVNDTRTAGSSWKLTANATTLVDTAGHTLKGGLVYVNSDGVQQDLTNQTVQVSDGTRSKGVNTVNAADSWANADNGKQTGIFLDAKPGTFSGPDETTYTGTMTWYLEATP